MTTATVGIAEAQHQRLRPRDRAALSVLLRGDARIRAGRVDERHEREPVALGELHRAHRLPVALRVRHPEVPVAPLGDVAALLVADERDRAAVERAEPGDDRVIVHPAAVAVELEPVVEDPLDVVERVRALLVAGELDRAPDLLVGRVLAQPLELTLQALELGESFVPRRSFTPESWARRSRSPSSASWLIPWLRTGAGAGRASAAAPVARHDGVDVAEAEVRLGEPEVVGQLLARRLRDDAGAGERGQRTGLGEDHVAEAREAGGHAARGRVREDREQRAAGVVQLADRARRSSAAASARGSPPASARRPRRRPRRDARAPRPRARRRARTARPRRCPSSRRGTRSPSRRAGTRGRRSRPSR